MMIFYNSVFSEKKFRKYLQKVGFLGNYPLIFTLPGQSFAFKKYFFQIETINVTDLWSCKEI